MILIDGSNFFFKLNDFHLSNLLSFDFSASNFFLCRDAALIRATYFVGKLKTDTPVNASTLLIASALYVSR